jgi:threonine/homoserine/homoserine lactone efflux protein
MRHLWKIFFTGMLVSFLGSLPLGTLNVAAMQIAVSDGIRAAMLFSLGSLLAEIVYVRLSLVAMDWVRRQEKLFKILEWVTLVIVVALAFSSFYAAMHPSETKNAILSKSSLPHVVLGLVMSAVNPVQIPFWFGWSTILFTKKILLPRQDHYNTYIIGIGLGTFMGNCLFIFGGRLIANKISDNQNILNWVIGGIFAVTGVIQLWKILKKKDPVSKLDHPEEAITEFGQKIVGLDDSDKKE